MIHFGNKSKLDYFRDLREQWATKNEDDTRLMERNYAQYKGSREIDGAPGTEASVVRNITYELIESQISTDIPTPHVSPKRFTELNARLAHRIRLRLLSLRDELKFEEMNDREERLAPIHGAVARVIDWDNSYRTHDTVGRPSVKVLNMKYITWQPGIYDVQDMDAVFVRYDTTKDDIMLRYNVEYKDVEEAEPDPENEHPDETVSVYTAWYRNEDNVVCKFVWSGDVILEDVENYWARKKYVCKRCGERREVAEQEDGKCRCGGEFEAVDDEYEELDEDIVLSDGRVIPAQSPVFENGRPKVRKVSVPATDELGAVLLGEDGFPVMVETEEVVMGPTRLPWYRPDMYPITVRKNTSQDESLMGQSDCEFIRDQQQQINKLESNIQVKSMGAGVYPVRPARSSFVYDKSTNQKVLVLEEGMSKNDFGVIDASVDTLHDQQLSDRAREHAKDTLGITASYQGQADTTAKSGYAKQLQIEQAAGRMASKRVMKQASYAEGDEAMFKLDLAYSDEPRYISYTDELGQTHDEYFFRYDHYEYDDKTGKWYVNDQFTFSCDSAKGIETQPELRWQMIASDYTAGLFGDPATTLAKLKAWRAREKAGYPDAHVQVEHFKEIYRAEQEAAAQAQQVAAAVDAQQAQQTAQINGGIA